MTTPIVILVLGFALLSILCLWFIKEVKGKWAAKFALVPAVLWFGIYLYTIPPNFAGYPTTQELTNENVIVRFFTYEAPTDKTEGVIYIVVDTRFFPDVSSKTFLDNLNPSTYSDVSGNEFLRMYKIPWDEELSKEMNKAKKKKQIIILSKNKRQGSGKGGDDKGKRGKGDKEGKNAVGKTGKEGEEGEEGNSGGSNRDSDKSKSKYRVKTLTPNEIFRKGE